MIVPDMQKLHDFAMVNRFAHNSNTAPQHYHPASTALFRAHPSRTSRPAEDGD
jgi:hypothetical protein